MNEKEIIGIDDDDKDNKDYNDNKDVDNTTTTTNEEIIELPPPTATTNKTNEKVEVEVEEEEEEEEEEVIEHVRLSGLLNDITKFNEQKKPQIKQEAIITIEKIVQSFLKTILTKSMTTTTNNDNNNNNNRLQFAEIYKVLLDYDLEFLAPSNGIVLKNTDDPINKYFECDNDDDNGDSTILNIDNSDDESNLIENKNLADTNN